MSRILQNRNRIGTVLFILMLFIGIISLPSCSTDFDIAADWKEITIAYGLLDVAQSTQYLRISKAFLSEDVSALEIAATADSLYHQQAPSVQLKGLDNSGNELQVINLEKVDANAEGLPKAEGIFATTPHFLYKTETPLNQEYRYELLVTTTRGNVITASTQIVKDFDIIRPTSDREINLLNETYTIRWETADNGFIYDLDIYLNYRDYTGQDTIPQRVKWNTFSNLVPSSINNRIAHDIMVEQLYSFVLRSVPEPAENIESREFMGLDFVFFVGSEELKKYNDVTRAQSGITAGQAAPQYTNLSSSSTNGALGLFSSRFQKQVLGVKFNAASLDDFACNELTRHLKFRPSRSRTSYPNCF